MEEISGNSKKLTKQRNEDIKEANENVTSSEDKAVKTTVENEKGTDAEIATKSDDNPTKSK